MLDAIINDPEYQIDRSSFVELINIYRHHYEELFHNRNNLKELSELEKELHRNLNNILSKS